MVEHSYSTKLFVVGVLLSVLAANSARADEVNARIRGTVTDQSGAVVLGVKLTARNVDTGFSHDVLTENDGNYEFLQLPIGNYSVKAVKPGFQAFLATGIHLVVNQIYVLNINLKVGEITQEISVQANPVQVETTDMQLGTVVGGDAIVDLPLNGRNWTQLHQLQPGVVGVSDGYQTYATNGNETDQNSYLLNGTDTNDLYGNTPSIIPSPDSIAEFRLVTNTINPEYGRNSGAILNAITKSGANQLHGSAFEFYRDTGLNARNFFSQSPAIFHQNQFGGTIGGPIWKNHTFFFFSYQGIRNRQPQPGALSDVTVFSQDQRNGLFPELAASTGTSPFSLVGENGKVYPAGTAYSTIFPTGHIPAADFNSISSTLMKNYVPPPNSGTSDFLFNPIQANTQDQEILRIDHTISQKDSLWGSWFFQRSPRTQTLPLLGATLPGFAEVDKSHSQVYTVSWTHVINNHMLNEARFGYVRLNGVSVFPVNPTLPSSVGFTGINPQSPPDAGITNIGITGLFSLGFSSQGPQSTMEQTYQLTDNFSITKGRHSLKFGFDMRRFQVLTHGFLLNNGAFGFGGAGPFTTGEPRADFLLGIPDYYMQASAALLNSRTREYYSYAQDQFRLRHNLTLTFGVGWQIDTPFTQMAYNNTGMNAFRPGQQSTVFPTAPIGLVFPGDTGVNAAGTTAWKDLGPRFGFAWSPDWGWISGGPGKLSIRGGYGIYYNRYIATPQAQFVAAVPFMIFSFGAGSIGSPGFADPFVDISTGARIANPFPFGGPARDVDFTPFEPFIISVIDPGIRPPYSENYNLTIERQLPADMILSVGYVGSVGHREIITYELNPGINPAGCAADPDCVSQRVGQHSLYPGNFKYPGNIYGSIDNVASVGNSNYNSLQVSLNKHFSRGLQFLAAYTWSHSLDNGSGYSNSTGWGSLGGGRGTNPFNRAADYGSSIFDARQRFVFSYTYALPSIRHFGIFEKLPSRLTDGWRIAGITTFQSGFPVDVTDGGFRSLTCPGGEAWACWDVPNVVGPAQYADPRAGSFVNGTKGGTTSRDHYWFNPNSFALEPFGTIGNAGRSILRGPGINNFDLALLKDIKLTEKAAIELRFEFYNLFNHTQFDPSGIVADINSDNFGRIMAARDPRLIQLAAKIHF